MYPNIILTNRLQPDSIVSDTVCATCDFNVSGKQCDRRMPWLWRGEFYPAQRNEVNMIRSQLESEMFPPKNPADLAKLRKSGGTDRSLMRTYTELSPDERAKLLRKRVSEYSRKVYHRLRDTQVQERTAVVCQRENPFYINTVRNFRDRRYIYKGLLKKEKKKLDTAFASGDQTLVSQGKKLVVLYDSLQLAHKCILNSFYGYVMRKQARWHSLEMAGVVCLTGSRIIQMARSRIDQLGRPLELDTDGIWCALPGIFPENYKFELKDGKGTFGISYPCTMLNHLVHDQFTNHQYQDLVDKDTFEYSMRSENSIFFEVDGPYKAMILPSSLEEDKLLKKRYAVFNDDGSLAELKGFEIKRRGELKLIKIFQSQIFGVFLEGKTLEECYAAVAKVANQWLDILFSRAVSLPEHELFDLITENRSMSKALESYGSQKSTAICTARRLAEFLGDQMVKDKGLACKFIISDKPHGLPVSERAIPVAIFSAEDSIKATYLRRWLKDPKLKDFDVRNILDWNYYLERFGSVIQKLITIPAAMQKVRNPVPRIKHPEWLVRKLRNMDDKSKQFRLTGMFKKVTRDEYLRESEDRARKVEVAGDIEDGVGGLVEAGDGKELTRVHRGVCRVSANARKRKRSGGGCDRDGEGEMAAATGEDSLTEAQQIEEAIRTLDERMPLISEDYARWLEVQKRKWVLQRQLRQLRKSQQQRAAKGGEGGVRTLSYPHAGGARDLSKFFSRAGHGSTGASSPWHVLQITETSTPGQLQAWVMILNQLHTVQITVPRTFYVSSSVPNDRTDSIPYLEDAKGMILPRVAHQTAAQYLYKCTVSESVFTEHQQEWASFFSHPSVVGVYETHISPLQRALINLGAMVQHHRRAPNFGGSSSNGGAAYSSDSSVHLDNLERFTPKSSQEGDAYQQTCVNGVKYIYLYHASARDGRQLFGLITTPNARGRVFVVDANARHLQMPNLEKLYEAKAREHKAQLKATTVSGSEIREAFEYPSAITFTATPYSTATAAYRAINTELSRYASERRGATFVVYHSPKPSSTMISTNLRVLGEFPHIAMPFHAADGQLAPLDWQRQAIKRMMGHYFHVAAWVQDRVELAKYANVPVGNLPADLPPMFLADIVFARRLVQAKHVLWWSSASRPDLGGREGDESEAAGLDLAELLDDISDGVAKKSKLALAGWKRRVETNSPGSYDTLCVDLDIQGLAVGTVVQAPHVNELEGTSGLGKFGAPAAAAAADDAEGRTAAVASIPLGDGAVPESIFQNLRSLLRGWCVQVAETNNRYAIMLAEHFYRWLTHPGSMLYDPSLVKLVRGLMAKVLMQLRAQVRKLGSKVVHCNSERLTIATSMKTVDAASAYVKYLVKTLAGQPVFEQISLVPVNYWLRLLWMDTCNFGGVAQPATAVASSESGSQGGSNEGSITTEPRVEMMWRIKEYLPPVTHQHFDSIVAQFTYELYQFSQETKSVIRSADDDDSKGNGGGDDVGGREEEEAMDPGPGSPGGLADDEPNPDNAGDNGGSGRGNDSARKLTKSKLWTMRNTFYRTLITQRFTRLLLDLVPRIQEACSPGHLPEEGSEEARFPPLPGIIPELHTGDAALEFVKAVVAVLSLESDAEFHVRILRRNLLSLLNVGEFSQMAFFQNPCQRLVLPQVVCDYCNYCRDVDFCQDADLSRPSATKGGENCGGSQVWSCVCCGQPYNRTVIEERLVQIAQQLVLAFQLQDLKCLKCRMVKQDNLNRHCQHCSGEFANQVPRSAMVRKLRIFASVAKYFRMPILNE
ncbi:DNA polymerase epsilon catalytic subunit, partial [Spiromyces aspiralis]